MTTPLIGLALGGGGARGLAHIPMLEAFDELGLKPAAIAGCSMGAFVGAAYACGMSGQELRQHALSLLNNRVEFARYVFNNRKAKVSELLSLKGVTSLHLQGEKLADVGLPDHLPKNIEEAKIPLKIVTADFERMEEVVITRGPVVTAVGASIAIPGLIEAPRINGRVHVDGGVVNPVPFDKVRDGMDVVVAIDVTGKPKPINGGRATNLELAVGSLLIMFHQLAESRKAHNPPDIYIEPGVNHFGSGDFFKVQEIFDAAEPAKINLKRALERRL